MNGPISPILRLQGIHLAIGGVQILRGVDLTLAAGERHVLIGPNGAGKTSLFNVATGQLRPSAGRVFFEDADITALPPFRRARLGLARTFQIASLFRELTVAENLLIAGWAPAPYFGASRDSAPVDALLDAGGLAGKRAVPVRNLAYGEQRQLEIALGLATRPRALLMDEPMAGLSPEERRTLAARIAGLGVPVLMVEHNLDDALAIADRITVLYLGEVVTSGPPAEVRRNADVQRIYLG